ncbi:hypothetical protein [Brevundimonas lenta]|uniref:Uncharacterized protein n=1 Tax=Brevundimonas lenta TaxID=424796 RepID=A0A7W6JCP2_9CAUL|nr:hypothetical protein [Brevundimonas lenta]MBB4081747.1 hypothetical protein [Brevundimonas lenta]
MNKNAARLGLAAIAAFYVVTGGLWAADYFPLQKFYAQAEVKDAIAEKVGYPAAFDTKEYDDAYAYQQTYALTHPSIVDTENKLALLGSLLLWGTVGLGVGGGVLFLTRRNGKGLPAAPKAE